MKRFIYIALLAGFFIGGYFLRCYTFEPVDTIQHLPDLRTGGYTYINPLLECNDNNIDISKELRPFKNSITNYLKDQQNSKNIEFAAVYFRDLNNGPWIGINEKELFPPASLLKVPIMISAYKKSESDPAYLHKKMAVSEEPDYSDQNFEPDKKLKKGDVLTIEQLIEQMIIYSDNVATNIIKDDLGYTRIMSVYNDLGLAEPDVQNDNIISIKNYASFYRILYNASYLSKDLSEKALSILAKTSFKKGLTQDLPPEIKVAHKFGEKIIIDNGLHLFHDCGIIYFPTSPYLLCIMTRGKDFNAMEEFIAGISKNIFDNVSSQKK
jgi:beta-lactamase class A